MSAVDQSDTLDFNQRYISTKYYDITWYIIVYWTLLGLEFWDGKKTLTVLQEDEYFEGKKYEVSVSFISLFFIFVITETITWCFTRDDFSRYSFCNAYIAGSIPIPEDGLGLSPKETYELALSALGACIWTLKRSLIDTDILQLCQFEVQYN